MAQPNEKLAEALESLKRLQDEGIIAIKSTKLPRLHRQRLVKNGAIKEVLKGWYIATNPDLHQGETGFWYASYWDFCAQYLNTLYGDEYFIIPDQSLKIHAGNWTITEQLVIRTTKKTNHNTSLLFGTSIWHWESPPPAFAQFEKVNGIRMLTLASSLVNSSATFFPDNPIDGRAALASVTNISDVTRLLLDGGNTTIAGRLAGAFRNIGRDKEANEIIQSMRAADFDVRETDPFTEKSPVLFTSREKSPYVNRIKTMWEVMRKDIIEVFPEAPGLPYNKEEYLKAVEDIYETDAYNSLSIERYVVSQELIERVRRGDWDLQNNEADKKQRDALAARGYWQAFQQVKESIKKVLEGNNAGKLANSDHSKWYRQLFTPSVTAGIIKASDLAGYRNRPVVINGSRHVPLNKDAVMDSMEIFFELLENETEASVRAVLGHFIFVYIHPYIDGNGRTARFLLNVMLASGGYPWTVIPVVKREEYMAALEEASVNQNIKPFAEFVASLNRNSKTLT